MGSWTIDAVNKAPTGIAIDPANVSHIWIVDRGTDRVYQYNAAAARSSGSQSAAASFALAAGNTNPQGIADSPAPETAELLRVGTTDTRYHVGKLSSQQVENWSVANRQAFGTSKPLTTSMRDRKSLVTPELANLLSAGKQVFEAFDQLKSSTHDTWRLPASERQVDKPQQCLDAFEDCDVGFDLAHDAVFASFV